MNCLSTELLLSFIFLSQCITCYQGPVANIYHGYPGSGSFVNIQFNKPKQHHQQYLVWLHRYLNAMMIPTTIQVFANSTAVQNIFFQHFWDFFHLHCHNTLTVLAAVYFDQPVSAVPKQWLKSAFSNVAFQKAEKIEKSQKIEAKF